MAQIGELMKCHFSSSMTDIEKTAWDAFMAFLEGFLGSQKSANYKDLVETAWEAAA